MTPVQYRLIRFREIVEMNGSYHTVLEVARACYQTNGFFSVLYFSERMVSAK